MPKVSRHYIDARRQEMLDAALACFARRGFHETTIEDIAREADVSHGVIYRYFASKDEIIHAVARRDHAARAHRFAEADEGRSAVQALGRLLVTARELHPGPQGATRRRLSAQVLAEGVRNPRVNEAIRETWDDVMARMTGIVRRGQAEGDIDPGLDPSTVARLLAAIHNGLVIHEAVDPRTDIPACLEIVEAMLGGTFARRGNRSKERSNGR
jgi:TetR/AcrR family transcriptional regulator, transcriptional repressor of aconitase